MKTQLLCTFTTKKDVHSLIDSIVDNFVVLYDKIFVLSTDTPYEVICSYNIEVDHNTQYLPNTISVHRKKETNTMYSVNALNEIVMQQNNGYLDKTFMVDWTTYRNSLVLTRDNELNVIPTEIFFIQRVKYR